MCSLGRDSGTSYLPRPGGRRRGAFFSPSPPVREIRAEGRAEEAPRGSQ